MKIKNIKLDEDGNPETITVDMSLLESAWIARIAGECKDMDIEGNIYSCLVGSFFNRFYEDGVNGVPKTRNPPIRYYDHNL